MVYFPGSCVDSIRSAIFILNFSSNPNYLRFTFQVHVLTKVQVAVSGGSAVIPTLRRRGAGRRVNCATKPNFVAGENE